MPRQVFTAGQEVLVKSYKGWERRVVIEPDRKRETWKGTTAYCVGIASTNYQGEPIVELVINSRRNILALDDPKAILLLAAIQRRTDFEGRYQLRRELYAQVLIDRLQIDALNSFSSRVSYLLAHGGRLFKGTPLDTYWPAKHLGPAPLGCPPDEPMTDWEKQMRDETDKSEVQA